MRKTYLLLLLAPAALVWACGGSDDSIALDGGPDATSDTAQNGDSANNNDSSNNDSSTNDGGPGNDSTTSTDSGTDAISLDLKCASPADCDGGNVCCVDLTVNGGKTPNCTVTDVVSVCKTGATCATNLAASVTCSGTDQGRLCTANKDCTENFYNKCCSFNGDAGGGVMFCANAQIVGNAGTCLQ